MCFLVMKWFHLFPNAISARAKNFTARPARFLLMKFLRCQAKRDFLLWNDFIRSPTRFLLMRKISRFAQRVSCLWNFCVALQNVFSCYEIISFVPQRVFFEWNNFAVAEEMVFERKNCFAWKSKNSLTLKCFYRILCIDDKDAERVLVKIKKLSRWWGHRLCPG